MGRTFIFVLSTIILAITIILFLPGAASAVGSVGDVGVAFDTTEVTQGASTSVEIDYTNIGDMDIEVKLVGIQFDWQKEDEYYSLVFNNPITLLPGELDMNTVPFDVPADATPGDHEFHVVIRFCTDGYSEVEWESEVYTGFTVLEKDTDGDGVGDNADEYPNDADKWKTVEDGGDRSAVYVLIGIIVMLGIITIVAVIVIYRLRKKDESVRRRDIVEARRSEEMMKEVKKRDRRKRRRERSARIAASSTDWKMCSCGARVADGEQLCEYCGKKVS